MSLLKANLNRQEVIYLVHQDWTESDRKTRLSQNYVLEESLSRWRTKWTEICSLEPHPAQPIPDYLRDCAILIYALRHYRWGDFDDNYWIIFCSEIFDIVTYPLQYELYVARASPVTRTLELEEAKFEVARFLIADNMSPVVSKHEEELKYYSIEAPSHSQAHHVGPRDSVEPVPSTGVLRGTDELHHGRMRMTDEAIMDHGPERRTDSPVTKQELGYYSP